MLTSGTEIGALLVDGLGDGVAIECPSEDLEFLRLMSFGLLQARALSAAICTAECMSVRMLACGYQHLCYLCFVGKWFDAMLAGFSRSFASWMRA